MLAKFKGIIQINWVYGIIQRDIVTVYFCLLKVQIFIELNPHRFYFSIFLHLYVYVYILC